MFLSGSSPPAPPSHHLRAAPVAAQTVLKMAHVYVPGNIWYESAEAYAKAVAFARSRGTLIAVPVPGRADALEWNVRLQGEGETVFFDV